MCSNPCESEVTCFRPESNRGPYGLLFFLSAALSTTELWWQMKHRKSFRTLVSMCMFVILPTSVSMSMSVSVAVSTYVRVPPGDRLYMCLYLRVCLCLCLFLRCLCLCNQWLCLFKKWLVYKERSFVYLDNDHDKRHSGVQCHIKKTWARGDQGWISNRRRVVKATCWVVTWEVPGVNSWS